jgi:nickel-dependent lactate racemase
MQETIKYGEKEELINIPDENLIGVAVPKQVPPPIDYDQEIPAALQHPTEQKPLHELAQSSKKICIIISDHTRPTPSKVLIPYIWEELAKGGIQKSQVSIILATGLHTPPDNEVITGMLGQEIMAQFNVVSHNAYDDDALVGLGKTSHDTPVFVNRLVVDSDLVISLSCIEPHRLYGWNGGAKNILPGVSGRKTIEVNHGRYLTHPGGLDMIEGNYFRSDAEEAARKAGLDFLVNVSINPNKEIIGIFTGDVVAAHREGVAFGRGFSQCPLGEKADIFICSLGGAPRDLDFWQAEGKGMALCAHMVKEGGTMILAARCENGIGAEPFATYMSQRVEEVQEIARTKGVTPLMIKALDMGLYFKDKSMILITEGLCKNDLPHYPVEMGTTVQEALDNCLAKYGPNARVLVSPQAPQVIVSC